jgi:O-antigen/teichoic acid export membrane protein
VDLKGLAEILLFSLNSLAARLLDFGGTRYVEIFIVSSLGSTALGFYLVGMRTYSALVQVLSNSMRGVAYSAFAELARDNTALCEAYYKTSAVAAIAAMPAFVLMAALAPELTPVIFGSKWQASVVVANAVALFGAIQLFDTYNGAVLNAIGKPSVAMRIAGLRLLATVAIFLMIQPQTLDSVVHLSIGIQLAAVVIPFMYLRQTIGLSIRRWAAIVAPSALCCIFGYLVVHVARSNAWFGSGNDFVNLFALGALGCTTISIFGLLLARQQILSTVRLVFRR